MYKIISLKVLYILNVKIPLKTKVYDGKRFHLDIDFSIFKKDKLNHKQ